MFWTYARFGVAALSLALWAGTATAQRGGGHNHGGHNHGGHNHGGHNHGGHNHGHNHWGHNHNHWGHNHWGNRNWNYGGYYGYYNRPWYGNYGYRYPNYGYGSFGYSYPLYGYSTGYYAQPSVVVQSSYTEPAAPAVGGRIQVFVPDPNAQIWIQGQATTSRGVSRLYESSPMAAGSTVRYTVRASFTRDGQVVTDERAVDVVPGQTQVIDFGKPPLEKLAQPF